VVFNPTRFGAFTGDIVMTITLLDLITAAMRHHSDLADAATAGFAIVAAHMAVEQPDATEQPRQWLAWYRSRRTAFESTIVLK
jgi:hypothetical protein